MENAEILMNSHDEIAFYIVEIDIGTERVAKVKRVSRNWAICIHFQAKPQKFAN
jgi:hypothetical protein